MRQEPKTTHPWWHKPFESLYANVHNIGEYGGRITHESKERHYECYLCDWKKKEVKVIK